MFKMGMFTLWIMFSMSGYAEVSKKQNTIPVLKRLESINKTLSTVSVSLKKDIESGRVNSEQAIKQLKESLDKAAKELKEVEKRGNSEVKESVKKSGKLLEIMRKMIQGLSKNVFDDVDKTIDELNKMSSKIE